MACNQSFPSHTTMSANTSESSPKIVAYLKTYCGWSNGVRAIFKKYGLDYEEKDIIQNPAFRWEMEQKSGQPLSPCVEVNGTMLADVSGDEVEAWMIDNGIVSHSDAPAEAPTDRACSDEQHAAMAAGQVGSIRILG
jgi:glutaredoxin-related protein